MTSATIKLEAMLMAARTGLNATAWEQWFRHVGITAITELHNRYGDCEHEECMRRATKECVDYIVTDSKEAA